MRTLRLISGLVTLALMATLATMATTSTASAAPAAVVSKVAAGDAAAKVAPAKKAHRITKNLREKRLGPQKFAILGKVSTFPNKRLFIAKDRCANKPKTCKFKRAGSDKTTRRGAFRLTAQGAGNCFILIVPATKRYRVTKKAIGCIS